MPTAEQDTKRAYDAARALGLTRRRRLDSASKKESALWLLDQLVPGGGVNNVPTAVAIDGDLDPGLLQAAVDAVIARHPALRTVFHHKHIGLVKEVLEPGDHKVVVQDLPDDDEALRAFMEEPFALDGGTLVRVGHRRATGGRQAVLCVVVHHLVHDAASAQIMFRELMEAYDAGHRGQTPVTTEVPAFTEPAPTEEGTRYWFERLTGFDATRLGLLIGAPDPCRPSLRGGQVWREFPEATALAVEDLATRLRVPESAILLAAYFTLLALHGAGPDIVVGSPLNMRDRAHAGAIGYHVNTVPVRAKVRFAEPFSALAARVAQAHFGALEHGSTSIDDVSARLAGSTSSWRNGIFRHMFNLVPYEQADDAAIGGLRARPLTAENGYSKFDLEFFLSYAPGRLRLRALHFVDVLSTEDVEFLVDRYLTVLDAVTAHPEATVGEIRPWAQRDEEIVPAGREGVLRLPGPDPLGRFAEACLRHPARPAVVDDHGSVTYQELRAAAGHTATVLRQAGAEPGSSIVLTARRGPRAAAGLFGAWLAGTQVHLAAPGTPDAPEGTLLLTDDEALTGPRVLHIPQVGPAYDTETDASAPAPDAVTLRTPDTAAAGGAHASVLTWAQLTAGIAEAERLLGDAGSERVLWSGEPTLATSVVELLLAVCAGGTAYAADATTAADPQALADVVVGHDLTVLQVPAPRARALAERLGEKIAGRRFLVTGDAPAPSLAETVTRAGGTLAQTLAPGGPVVYAASAEDGRFVAAEGAALTVASKGGREYPALVLGELCVVGTAGGEGTRAHRVRHPRHGAMHRTAVHGRRLADGGLELTGRAAPKTVVRGVQLRLDLVEEALCATGAVTAAAADVVRVGEEARLVLAVTDGGASAAEATAVLRRLVPVPLDALCVHACPAIPTTPYGTVDRAAVAELARAAVRQDEQPSAAEVTDPTVRTLVALFEETTGTSGLHPASHFFDSGGHSLLGARLLQRIEQELGVTLKLADLFGAPTPAALAHEIDPP
ncbi:condensation domain-containing protein [Streptomyces halobius]|uniref:Condensation domain-containing protein n=1 Tax=Streptomyces halobius TaxID=2879846 RepID=A0ABY4MM67_9ACTN|nr:condensation domain-containing protein [Streptomyces halobius]UQA97426.1 condensation domain-containing protein [Streptomyces halobius]